MDTRPARMPESVELCQRPRAGGLPCLAVLYRPAPGLVYCYRCGGNVPGVIYTRARAAVLLVCALVFSVAPGAFADARRGLPPHAEAAGATENTSPIETFERAAACAVLTRANAEDARTDRRLVPDPGYLCAPSDELVFDYEGGEYCRLYSATFNWVSPGVYPEQISMIHTLRFLCIPLGGGPWRTRYLDRDTAPQPGHLTPWREVTTVAPCRTPFGPLPFLCAQ